MDNLMVMYNAREDAGMRRVQSEIAERNRNRTTEGQRVEDDGNARARARAQWTRAKGNGPERILGDLGVGDDADSRSVVVADRARHRETTQIVPHARRRAVGAGLECGSPHGTRASDVNNAADSSTGTVPGAACGPTKGVCSVCATVHATAR